MVTPIFLCATLTILMFLRTSVKVLGQTMTLLTCELQGIPIKPLYNPKPLRSRNVGVTLALHLRYVNVTLALHECHTPVTQNVTFATQKVTLVTGRVTLVTGLVTLVT